MRLPLVLYIAPISMMVLSIPMILKKVPKNRFYGMRTEHTLTGSDEQWYQANYISGLTMFIAGVIACLAFVIVPHLVSDIRLVLMICLAVLLLSVLAAVAYSTYSQRDA